MNNVRIGLLGSLEVHLGGERLKVGGPKDRLLLVRLALNAGRVVATDSLIESLWGHGGSVPEDPANALQVKISRLRKIIGPERLVTCAPGYVLDIAETDVDALAFRQLVRTGRSAMRQEAHVAALAAYSRALALWRGPALLDVAEDYTVETERMCLEDERIDAVEDKIEIELALGRHGSVIADLQSLVRDHPLRERLWAQLMTALYREGRQAEALETFATVRSKLVEQLGIEPGPELSSLQQRILVQDADLRGGAPTPTREQANGAGGGNLREPRTTFVGREAELAMLESRLMTAPLLTLTGPGGAGKTRLALEAGRRLRNRFRDGVWVVDLSEVRGREAVLHAVAGAIGVPDVTDPLAPGRDNVDMLERIASRFRDAEALLVLDECEHVLPSAAETVEAIYECCPNARVLATSREPLGVDGEYEQRVSPLTESDAVALFVDRATAIRPALDPGGDDEATIRSICDRLDHIPLAVELAAARVKVLPLEQIASRLNDRFGFLVSEGRRSRRQQTLRATVDWSYDLLSEEERIAFEQLSVFKCADYEAIGELCFAAGLERANVLDVISRLIDKSMLIADVTTGGHARYSMLETLREYGIEKLAQAGRLDRAREQHATLFMRRAEDIEPLLKGPRQRHHLSSLEQDEDNILAALDWAIEKDEVELGLRLGVALGWYWYLGGRPHDGRRRLLELASRESADPALRARALGVAGLLAERTHHLTEALDLTEQALEVVATAGDAYAVAMVQAQRGQVLGRAGRTDAASAALVEAIAAFEALDRPWEVGAARLALGYNHLREPDFAAAEAELAAALVQFEAVGDVWSSIRSLTALAGAASAAKGPEAGQPHMAKAVTMAKEAGLEDVAARLGELPAGIGPPAPGADGHGATHWPVASDARPVACNSLGVQARQQGDLDLARALHEEALSWYRTIEWRGGTAVAKAGLAAVAQATGDTTSSCSLYGEALDDARASGDGHALAMVLEGLAALAVASSASDRAGFLLGAANAVRRRHAIRRTPTDRVDFDRVCNAAGEDLGAEAVRAAVERGERAGVTECLEAARSVIAPAARSSVPSAR